HRFGVVRITRSPGDFVILDSRELVVLLPEVALQNLGRGEKPEDRDVSLVETAVSIVGESRGRVGKQPGAKDSGSSRGEPAAKERASIRRAGRRVVLMTQDILPNVVD